MFPGTRGQDLLRAGRALRETAVRGENHDANPASDTSMGPFPRGGWGGPSGSISCRSRPAPMTASTASWDGPRTRPLSGRNTFAVEEVLAELERKLAEKDLPDYISLAGSGEPTLNAGIGDLIGKIKV